MSSSDYLAGDARASAGAEVLTDSDDNPELSPNERDALERERTEAKPKRWGRK